MFIGDGQEVVDPVEIRFRPLVPHHVVEEDAYRVHADVRSPSELAVDGSFVVGVRLPHFKYVDCVGGDEVHSH